MNNQFDIGEIYREFREPLKAFIGKRISDQASTEDLLHDVFLRIHNNINSLTKQEKLAPWIYRIARNVVIDFYRQRRDTVSPPEEMSIEEREINEIPEKLAPVVRSMVERLPPKYRNALLLADFEGVKQTEVAKQLGVSISGAKSRVQRARKMLKHLLLECCHFEFDRYGTVFSYHPKNCTHCCEKNSDCSGSRPFGL